MRRIALILLIALLPLQSIWAAAANACQQECSGSSGQFGQHDHGHEHPGVAHEAPADVPGDLGAACGSDCSSTHDHGCCAAALFDDRPALTASPPGITPSADEWFSADRCVETPLRPPLLPFA